MNTRRRAFVAVLIALTAIAAVVLWSAVFRDRHPPTVEKPPKTTAELLIGSWKEVQPGENPTEPVSFEIVYHFAADGSYELRVWDLMRGYRVMPGTYQLDGNTLRFLSPVSPSFIAHDEICERASTIESITEQELVIVTVTKKRWTPEMAQTLADANEVPVGPLLAQVREERHRNEYVRVK